MQKSLEQDISPHLFTVIRQFVKMSEKTGDSDLVQLEKDFQVFIFIRQQWFP